MKKERDLLQDVIDDLAEEYAQKGWQIEAVDLRWGISKEAGLDNKTMQICLEELKRCQKLSPKPNFIILLGNRYGWVPLPEKISPRDVHSIIHRLSHFGKLNIKPFEKFYLDKNGLRKLFFDWYKLDENSLPDGEYVLQRRTGVFVDDDKWDREVYRPLSLLFFLLTDGTKSLKESLWANLFMTKKSVISTDVCWQSATELEIQAGALQVEDAHDHVIAYFRELLDVPDAERCVFFDSDVCRANRIKNLRNILHKKLSKDNTFDYSLSYDEYRTTIFTQNFKTNIRKRITAIIEATISNKEEEFCDEENLRHTQIAKDESETFIGREKELEDIRKYINTSDDRSILWYKSNSGSGKTALLAKIYQLFKEDCTILCRFCGRTPHSLHLYDIMKDVRTVISSNQRPLLIIIDAVNQTDDASDILEYFDFNKELPIGVKFIISSTDEYPFRFNKPNVRFHSLPAMGDDSWRLVSNVLLFNKRRLSTKQERISKEAIERSDKSALYLHMLGQFLSQISSWDTLSEMPTTLTKIVELYISELSQPGRHGGMLIRKFFSYMCAERIGLSQKEILELLADDDEYWIELNNNAKHLIEKRRVPNVIWSRLENDLIPFLRNRNTNVGQLYMFFHQQLKDVLSAIYLKDKNNAFNTHKKLYYYYRNHATLNERHSLYEVCWQGIHSTQLALNNKEGSEVARDVFEILTKNIVFLSQMMKEFPTRLWESYELAHSLFDENGKRILKQIKLSLSDYCHHDKNAELFPLYSRSMPTYSPLRQIADFDYADTVMPNILSDVVQESTVIHSISATGKYPIMSEDGNRVLALYDACHEVRIFDCLLNKIVSIYSVNDEILEIQSDDSLRYNALRTRNSVIVWDNETRKEILNHQMQSPLGNWLSLSNNGQILAIGDGDYVYFYFTDKSIEDKSYVVHLLAGKITPSGDFLWSITKDGTICRTEILSGKGIVCDKLDLKKVKMSAIRIAACTDNLMEYYSAYSDTCPNLLYHLVDESGKHVCINIADANMYALAWPLINEKFYIVARESFIMLREIKFGPIENNCYSECVKFSYIDAADFEKGFRINREGSRALACTEDHMYVIDLNKHFNQFHSEHGGNSGINNMCCSNDGKAIMVSTGINREFDKQDKVLCIDDDEIIIWTPPFIHKGYDYVAGTAISPDRRFFAVSSCCLNNDELILSDSKRLKTFCCYQTNDSCIALRFSSDSKYLIAKTGGYISSPIPTLYLLDIKGNLLFEQQMDSKAPNNQHIFISLNNRYILFSQYGGGMIFDIIERRFMYENRKFSFYDEEPKSFPIINFNFKGSVAQLPNNIVFARDEEKKKLLVLSLADEKIIEMPFNVFPIACSPSGRKVFYLNQKNGELSMSTYPLNGNFISLMTNVEFVVTALDDSHVFVLLKDGVIVLLNVDTSIVEQRAFFGWTKYMIVTKQGLVVSNDFCEIGHFKPSDKYCVNSPAITTFVRHWNLNSNQQEEPVAICPACGGEIRLSSQLERLLRVNPRERQCVEWDNPQLLGHHCPHCRAELRFNPYIV